MAKQIEPNGWGGVVKVLGILIIAFGLIAVLPNSIKTGYNSGTAEYAGLNIQLEHYGDGCVLISWDIDQEQGVVGYEIQRRSLAEDFQTVGYIPAYGIGVPATYRYVDQPEQPGMQTYRIRVDSGKTAKASLFSYTKSIFIE